MAHFYLSWKVYSKLYLAYIWNWFWKQDRKKWKKEKLTLFLSPLRRPVLLSVLAHFPRLGFGPLLRADPSPPSALAQRRGPAARTMRSLTSSLLSIRPQAQARGARMGRTLTSYHYRFHSSRSWLELMKLHPPELIEVACTRLGWSWTCSIGWSSI